MPTINKTPRKDTTRTARQQRRRALLDTIARAAGYASWSQYETAVINQQVTINGKEEPK